MIRKRIVFAVLLGAITTLSGVVLTSGALIYYTGFLDGNKRCSTAGLVR